MSQSGKGERIDLHAGYYAQVEASDGWRWHIYSPQHGYIGEFDNDTDARAFLGSMTDARSDFAIAIAELRREEWSARDSWGQPHCPWCGRHKPGSNTAPQGHAENCRFLAVLVDAVKATFPGPAN